MVIFQAYNLRLKCWREVEMVEYVGGPNGIKSEYAIWGYPPNSNEHTLLVFAPNGKVITDSQVAEKYARQLEEIGCTGVTVQKITYY